MWLLLLYPLLFILLCAACASLACRLLGAGRLGWQPALLYGGGAFLVMHGGFVFGLWRGVLPLLLPFIALVIWGWFFFLRWPRHEAETVGLEAGLCRSLLAAGLYFVVGSGMLLFLFSLDGWNIPAID